jgi:small subunit ribosomal protein S8e
LFLCLFVLCQGSNHVQRKLKERLRGHKKLDAILADQFTTGRLYACISR